MGKKMIFNICMRKFWCFFIGGGILFICDQILKNWACRNLYGRPNFLIFNNFFSLEFYQNRGIAFGFPLLPAFFYFSACLIFVFLIIAGLNFWRRKKYFALLGVLLVALGALSNFIDRLRFGYVIDYLNLAFWPVFNLADLMILGGVLMLIAQSRKRQPKADRPRAEKV